VLLGRDAGADTLRTLQVGDRVSVGERLVPAGSRVPYVFAVAASRCCATTTADRAGQQDRGDQDRGRLR